MESCLEVQEDRRICLMTMSSRLGFLAKYFSQVKLSYLQSFLEQIATLYDMVTSGSKTMTYVVIGNIALQLFL